MKTFIAISFFCILSFHASAQRLTDTISLTEVSIHGSYGIAPPGIVKTSVDTAFLIENQFNAITEILHNYTPVFVKSYGNGGLATVSFRGTHASHTKVQWNGLDINSPMLGQVDFSNIPVFFFDEMELYHGNSSLLNGSGGLGGSIVLNTQPAWGNKLNVSVANQAGSFTTYSTGLKVNTGSPRAQLHTRLFYGCSKNDFSYFNDSEPGGGWETNQNAGFHSFHLMQEMYQLIGNSHQFSFAVWTGLNNRSVPPLMNYSGIYREEQLDNRDLKATGSWKYFGSKNAKWMWTSGYNYNQMDYFLGDSVNNYSIKDAFDTISYSRSTSQILQNKLECEKEWGHLGKLLVSVYHHYNLASTRDDAPLSRNGYDAYRNTMGVMMHFEKAFSSGFSTFIILRQERVDDHWLPPAPLLGMQYAGKYNWHPGIKLSFAANHNMPSLNALYWVPWGNPDLKTEKGYSGDLAISVSKANDHCFFSSGLNLFGAYMYDWIMWVPGKSARNVQEVFSRGVECTIRLKVKLGNFNYLTSLNYSFTRTTSLKSSGINDNSEGKQLIYIPLHKAGIYTKWDFKGYYIKHTFTYTDKRFSSLDNDEVSTLPAYNLQDISAGKELSWDKWDFEFYSSVQNLFDQTYQSVIYRAMPGRHYTLSFIMSFKK